ncbi:uncharacterized protein LOC143533579 [Bidens hawaiensis]|uniref:uncharacterized protein LOC143533579 n=1 Tax=Bidens hawaiensis TaxID=980011 RepID=UPI004049A0FA
MGEPDSDSPKEGGHPNGYSGYNPIAIHPEDQEKTTFTCPYVGAVLGQWVEKKPVAIYYASKTLSDAQLNYTTTEKKLLAVVYALNKFRSYIWGSKEFDLEIRDKKGTENVVADHLSRIMLEGGDRDGPVNESFPDEQILAVSQNPWFAHIVNFKVAGDLPEHCLRRKKKHLKTVRTDQEDWSTNLTDAFWAYRTAFITPIGTTPYRLVYGKDCHLPVEIAQRAYWATKEVNTSYDDAGKARKLALCEIEELRDEAYECASAYKEKMKKVHDAKIRLKRYEFGQKVWLYNTRMKLFLGKLKSKWPGPFVIVGVGNHGQFKIEDFDYHIRQVVNGYRLKPYLEMEDIHKMDKASVSFIVTSSVYEDN